MTPLQPDAFINSGLERWLRVRGIESLVVVAVSTNNSVESSVPFGVDVFVWPLNSNT